ncbi:MAG: formate transporter FocA [Anaerolineae bacterium]|nr:formate transporter FocA [Anaerolineae bacterium]
MTTNSTFSIDALVPAEMAHRAETIGVRKATSDTTTLLVLALLAGAFIGLGALFSTTVTAGAAGVLPYGITRLLAGLAFSLGLILVIVGGAELFTGNNLVVMAWASRKITTRQLLRNWGLVYVGNFVGAALTALLVFLAGQYASGGGAVGLAVLATAQAKTNLPFVQALVSGVLCNALVCLAVWLTYSARSTTDRIMAIVFPITAFVAAGFEHCIANMYFIPLGLLVRQFAPATFWTQIGASAADYATLTWVRFVTVNLIPVTIGNIIGGSVLVGAVYWFVYMRHHRPI